MQANLIPVHPGFALETIRVDIRFHDDARKRKSPNFFTTN